MKKICSLKEKNITNTCQPHSQTLCTCNCMFSIWKMNELSLIDELDETENQFILFAKMAPIIHWLGSPKKTTTKIYNYG